MLIGTGWQLGNMLDEASFKFPLQYIFLIIQKSLGTFLNQQSYDAGTQIGNLLIDIADKLQRFEHMRFTLFGKIGKK